MNKKDNKMLNSRLSPRELELLSVLNKGYCFKQSAEILGVKETTAKTLAYRAYKRLGVSNLQSALYEIRNQNLI
jgi:DNA-binding NarL/FixJ family response regulator